jgi:hypothetical protein
VSTVTQWRGRSRGAAVAPGGPVDLSDPRGGSSRVGHRDAHVLYERLTSMRREPSRVIPAGNAIRISKTPSL